ncbi:MAG TPA: hypothetical protein VGM50_12000 [Gemmatimonadaceae bacterium]|jgi:hypothetical protein
MPRSTHLSRLAAILGAVAVVGCSDSTAPASFDVTGTWNLRIVDGVSVDAAPPANDPQYVRVHEQLMILAGGTYRDSVHNDVIDDGSGALVDGGFINLTGKWTYDGATTLHLIHDEDGTNEPGIVGRDTLRIGTSIFTR